GGGCRQERWSAICFLNWGRPGRPCSSSRRRWWFHQIALGVCWGRRGQRGRRSRQRKRKRFTAGSRRFAIGAITTERNCRKQRLFCAQTDLDGPAPEGLIPVLASVWSRRPSYFANTSKRRI